MRSRRGGVRGGSGNTVGRPGGFVPPAVLAMLVVAACGSPPVLEEWTLQLEETMVVGGEDAPPETAFHQPSSLRFDAAGNAYVLDAGNHRVQVLRPDGSLLASLGQAGEGPGDLMRPEGMWVFPDGEVVVADTGNARLQRFGPGRQPIASVELDFLPLDVVGTPSRLWVLRLPPASLLLGPDPSPLVEELDRDGHRRRGFVDPRPADMGLLYFIANALRIAPGPDGGFAVAETHLYSRIRRYDSDGIQIGEIDVLYKADSLAPLGRVPDALTDASLARIARTSTDLAWDSGRGLYWLLAGYTDRRQDGSWLVARELYRYAPDGTYRGSVMLPFEGREVAPAPDGSIWLLAADGAVHRMRLTDPDVLHH